MASLTSVAVRSGVRRPHRRGDSARHRNWELISQGTAIAVALALGTGWDVRSGLTVGGVLGIALLPVWLPHARRRRGAGILGLLTVGCLVAGPVLTSWSSADHGLVHNGTKGALLELVSLAVGAGVLMWACDVLSSGKVATFYALGCFPMITHGERFAEDHWRFGFAVPVTLLALGLCLIANRWVLDVLAVAALALVSAAAGARSMSAFLLLALVLALWMHRPTTHRRSASAVMSLAFVGALGFGIYKSIEAAALEGYLGTFAQERTQLQIRTSGSLILGGRPEAGATVALMRDHPLGYGTGTAPSAHDILVAQSGMSRIGYDPNNGYVEHYMMGSGIELHSFIGDLWVWFGLVGAVAGVCLLVLGLRYIGHGLATKTASTLGIYLAVTLCWDIFFGPIHSAVRYLDLGLALILLRIPAGSEDAQAAVDRVRRARPHRG